MLYSNCQNESKQQQVQTLSSTKDTTASESLDTQIDFDFHMVIANVGFGSSTEIMNRISRADIKYNQTLPNPLSNEKKYQTSFSQALNYGTYTVDLAYLSNYEQSQQVINYYSIIYKLAKNIGATESFEKVVGSRLEQNANNKDSLSHIINQMYNSTDEYLRTNKRLESASLILTGSWVECQYILLNSLKGQSRNTKNKFLYDKVYEQKLHLNNLLKLLEHYKDKEGFQSFSNQLADIFTIYKGFQQETDVTQESIIKLCDKISGIRKGIIN